jgi:hypothetical protein
VLIRGGRSLKSGMHKPAVGSLQIATSDLNYVRNDRLPRGRRGEARWWWQT